MIDNEKVRTNSYPQLESVARAHKTLLIGTFAVSGILTGYHVAKSRCNDGERGCDCLLAALHAIIFGSTGNSVVRMLYASPPNPGDPGTPPSRSSGDG